MGKEIKVRMKKLRKNKIRKIRKERTKENIEEGRN